MLWVRGWTRALLWFLLTWIILWSCDPIISPSPLTAPLRATKSSCVNLASILACVRPQVILILPPLPFIATSGRGSCFSSLFTPHLSFIWENSSDIRVSASFSPPGGWVEVSKGWCSGQRPCLCLHLPGRVALWGGPLPSGSVSHQWRYSVDIPWTMCPYALAGPESALTCLQWVWIMMLIVRVTVGAALRWSCKQSRWVYRPLKKYPKV